MAKFNNDAFLLASAKVGMHGRAIDKRNGQAATDVNAWAQMATAGIIAGKLTIDAVKAQLIADYRLSLPKKEQEDFDVDTATIGDCGNTVKGWFYALARIVKAGDETMRRVCDKGEAFNSVARDTKPRQEQSGKGGKGAPKAKQAKPLPTLAESIAALRGYIGAATADNAKALALANNGELAGLIGDIAKLQAKVEKLAATPAKKAA